ncbi:hypothetical protein [Nonomuraea sp. NPDC052265]|uniref:hypothetical protein n=1 Tax=Nonomuraea sp. NPDC052265 TaxID=3364374 RepID=UPI0037CA9001
MTSNSWHVGPDAVTDVIPRITAPIPVVSLPATPALTPVEAALREPAAQQSIPVRPWRAIWCALSLGHFWWLGGSQCLDCGWTRGRGWTRDAG